MKHDVHDVNLSRCNVDEKRHIVCCHGKKLAIAFNLVKRCPGSTVRTIMNLGICRDFPTAAKVIKMNVGQEIQSRYVTASTIKIVCAPLLITAEKSLM